VDVFPGAGARSACRAGEGGGAGLIKQWRKALVLAPHTDDGEFGCGGTMVRLADSGCEVRYVAFSIATRSLPEGFSPDTLAREVRDAIAELGIPEERLTVHDFDVRTFPEHRQGILEVLVALWEEWQPDVVFQPSLHDVHQDHKTIAEEGLRAFKRTTILGYEIPWNNFDFAYQWYVALEKRHIERKVSALEKYASQQHRRYANPEYVWNVARTHGINVNREYAEVFQVYRVIT
jgi:LmbE family N-acetylglucosaminyl deacetylase